MLTPQHPLELAPQHPAPFAYATQQGALWRFHFRKTADRAGLPAHDLFTGAQVRALRGQFDVAVALLRECIGPLEVSAALNESDDGEQMDALIQRAQKFVADAMKESSNG